MIKHDYRLLRQTRSPRPLLPERAQRSVLNRREDSGGAGPAAWISSAWTQNGPLLSEAARPHPLFTPHSLTSSESSTDENQELA